MLGPAVRRLSDRERKILHLRFFNGWTQEEIAREIGVTQMHVSRLLTRIIDELRAELS
jgi:RNA polymerase sigma-B factor